MHSQKMSAYLHQRAEGVTLKIYNKLRSLGVSEQAASLAVYPIALGLLLSVPFLITSTALTVVFILFCSSFLLAVFLCGVAFFVSCVCGVIFVILIVTGCAAVATLVATGFVITVLVSLSVAALPLIGILRASGRANVVPSYTSGVNSTEAKSTDKASDFVKMQPRKVGTADDQLSG